VAPPAAPAAASSTAPAADRTRPRLTNLALSRSAIRGRQSTRLLLTLSERASVTVAVERCAATKRRTRRCALPTRVATLRRANLSGLAKVKLTRRFPERTLARGRYRLKVTAVDAAGNRSAPVTRLLTVR
jgi:hypothetical protein